MEASTTPTGTPAKYDHATTYAEAAIIGTGDCITIQATSTTTWTAINYACGQRGLPYVWGGNGATDGGFWKAQ